MHVVHVQILIIENKLLILLVILLTVILQVIETLLIIKLVGVVIKLVRIIGSLHMTLNSSYILRMILQSPDLFVRLSGVLVVLIIHEVLSIINNVYLIWVDHIAIIIIEFILLTVKDLLFLVFRHLRSCLLLT